MVEDHDVVAESWSSAGWLGRCWTCGWRADKVRTRVEQAQEDADDHLWAARTLRLNTGPRPSARMAMRIYRQNSENPVFTDEERQQWRQLADELEIELASRVKGPLEGQMELF